LLTACELVSEPSLGLVLQHIPAAQRPIGESPWHVLIELSSGGEDAALRERMRTFQSDLEATARAKGAALRAQRSAAEQPDRT